MFGVPYPRILTVGAEPGFVYEQMVQKLENDVRNHIKVENQLKLILGKRVIQINSNVESTQFKFDDYDKMVKDQKSKLASELEEKETKIKVRHSCILLL